MPIPRAEQSSIIDYELTTPSLRGLSRKGAYHLSICHSVTTVGIPMLFFPSLHASFEGSWVVAPDYRTTARSISNIESVVCDDYLTQGVVFLPVALSGVTGAGLLAFSSLGVIAVVA